MKTSVLSAAMVALAISSAAPAAAAAPIRPTAGTYTAQAGGIFSAATLGTGARAGIATGKKKSRLLGAVGVSGALSASLFGGGLTLLSAMNKYFDPNATDSDRARFGGIISNTTTALQGSFNSLLTQLGYGVSYNPDTGQYTVTPPASFS